VRRSLEILSVKKEANLSGRGMDEEEVGDGLTVMYRFTVV